MYCADGTRIEDPADARDLELRVTGDFVKGDNGDFCTSPTGSYFKNIDARAINFDKAELPRVLAEMHKQFKYDPYKVFEEALFEEVENADHDDYC